ncbi:MSMEG_1061 family FMN-dependent PPOX-type flavoprotein [Azospirillum sp. ST 5-10]|uniref:MSMEG_1061 family FMN-dependent PPOX-type flavoprotein n=1 Tax=unclassified Azospirillum TaxID=2630922 RepID=UPI003F4A1766
MPDTPDPHRVTTADELRTLYEMPSERIVRMKFPAMDDHVVRFIAAAPLVFFATRGPGGVDNSPRGGEPGFVHVIDRRHLAIPDWPGNNKLESMGNLLDSDGACGLVFLVPHQDAFLRVNGTATLTRDPALLARFETQGRRPKLALRVAVEEVYFHCGKALRRSHLWAPDRWRVPADLPSVGTIVRDQGRMTEMSAEELDRHYQQALETELY